MSFRVVSLVGGLGFVTLLVCSLLLAFSIETRSVSRAVGTLLLILVITGIVCAALVKGAAQKAALATASAFAVIAGVTLWLVPPEYYQRASYANRAAVFFFAVLPVAMFMTILWPVATRCAIKSVKENANIDESQELTLYLAASLASALLLALVAPITSKVELRHMREAAITNSVAVWFVAAGAAAVMGLMIERRATENTELQETPEAATSKPATEYEQIPKSA